eukprot:1186344-Prorocentrum_minimum.AAC.4
MDEFSCDHLWRAVLGALELLGAGRVRALRPPAAGHSYRQQRERAAARADAGRVPRVVGGG